MVAGPEITAKLTGRVEVALATSAKGEAPTVVDGIALKNIAWLILAPAT